MGKIQAFIASRKTRNTNTASVCVRGLCNHMANLHQMMEMVLLEMRAIDTFHPLSPVNPSLNILNKCSYDLKLRGINKPCVDFAVIKYKVILIGINNKNI